MWPYLVAVLIFIALIIIHEFGHFIAAKLLGVRVNEFAVGFGPKLFSKKQKMLRQLRVQVSHHLQALCHLLVMHRPPVLLRAKAKKTAT